MPLHLPQIVRAVPDNRRYRRRRLLCRAAQTVPGVGVRDYAAIGQGQLGEPILTIVNIAGLNHSLRFQCQISYCIVRVICRRAPLNHTDDAIGGIEGLSHRIGPLLPLQEHVVGGIVRIRPIPSACLLPDQTRDRVVRVIRQQGIAEHRDFAPIRIVGVDNRSNRRAGRILDQGDNSAESVIRPHNLPTVFVDHGREAGRWVVLSRVDAAPWTLIGRLPVQRVERGSVISRVRIDEPGPVLNRVVAVTLNQRPRVGLPGEE